MDPNISEGAALVSQEKLTAGLVHHLLDEVRDYAIFAITIDGKLATWNAGVQRVLGYGENEFVGRSFSEIFSHADRDVGLPESELAAAMERGRAEDERWHRRKDGSLFWASGLVTRMDDSEGRHLGFVKIMRDQTQRKEFEEELARQTNALMVANEELRNFAGIVSHDLNAPLQTVFGCAHLLSQKQDMDEEATESLHYIIDGTRRLISLVDQLLKETTSDSSPTEQRLVDSGEVLADVLQTLRAPFDEKNAGIFYESLPAVWVDGTRLGRVFQNLVENALKYADPARPPSIEVSARPGTHETIFTVKDNGVGIAESDFGRIFARFHRVEPEGAVKGHGLGLASCKHLVETWGGRIWVESALGEGTSFHFSVPHPKPSGNEVDSN